MAQGEAVFGEVHRRLVHLGLPEDVQDSVMALLRGSESKPAAEDDTTEADFAVRVARTFYRTALRATEALGTSSISSLIMLFDLFVAYEQKRPISVSSLCIASGAASTTALRQIRQLEDRGFLTREGDTQDRRRSWVSPTPRALDLTRGVIADWMAVLQPKGG